jgi:DNA adenine methylase
MPKRYKRYIEPFVGGGAFFFSLGAEQALIADTNAELILTYETIRDEVEGLAAELAKHRYEREYFLSVRDWDRRPDFAELPRAVRAARFIFLNKTCFNGLYRVNSKGHFNVPFGSYSNPRILDRPNLVACSRALAKTEIVRADYLALEEQISEGDFVYFDPPYAPLSATSSFTSYTSDGFDANDQVALRDLCVRLDQKGVLFMLSNSSSLWIRELYNRFSVHNVSAPRAINAKAAGRGPVDEIVVTNYKSFFGF